MLEDISYTIKKAAAFLTGRGATASIIGAATAVGAWGESFWLASAAGLVLGVPITAAMATMSLHHRQHKIHEHVRDEVGAALGIDPKQVTIDDMRKAAKGDPERGIPANNVLGEVFQRLDRHRAIGVLSNILAAVITIGVVFTAFRFGIPGFAEQWLGESIQAPLLAEWSIPTRAIALAGVSSLSSLTLDTTFKHVGMKLFGYDNPSVYKRIEHIENGLRHGHHLTQDHMMGLIVDSNPQVAKDIERRFGKPYNALPIEARAEVLQAAEPLFHLRANVEAINLGLIPAKELVFAVQAQRSGVHPPVEALVAAYEQELQAEKAQQRGHVPQHPAKAPVRPFVDRVRGFVRATGLEEPISFVEKLERQMMLFPGDQSKSVH